MTEPALLLVDDEENILRALTRVLRRDGYRILTATSGPAALDVLEKKPSIGVILSDQRMPGMTGSEFLRLAKERFPYTVRLMLSGYTELGSVTAAINEGAIYKFLTKPWEDELLRVNVREAFEQHRWRAEHQRLAAAVRSANEALCVTGEAWIERGAATAARDQTGKKPEISREILEHLPIGVVGIDEQGIVTIANSRAHDLLGLAAGALMGRNAAELLPQELNRLLAAAPDNGGELSKSVRLSHGTVGASAARLVDCAAMRGSVLVIMPKEAR